MEIKINNKTLEELGLILLDGSLVNLLKPVELKQLILNENASIDGSLAILTNRKVKSRDVAVRFLVKSISALSLVAKIDEIIKDLINGVKDVYGVYTGETELSIAELGRKYRLVYMKSDQYASFGNNKAILSITFKELNPKNNKI